MDDLTSNDVRGRLSDAVRTATKDTGNWAYYIDHTGDDESGDCYYSCGGDVMCSPYEMSKAGDSAPKAVVHHDQGMKVVPRTIYEPEADDADEYAAMSEAAKIYTKSPYFERFISKSERDSMDAADFAGKNKSYPIKTQADVDAAFHALGRAGSDNYSVSTIRGNIIRIAKRKGFRLPKSAQSTDAKESASIKITESMPWAEELLLSESVAAGVEREIRIIVPCKGSSAVYTEAALKKSIPAFRAGTQMYINHATRAEEAARPEGDWRKLVGQLTSDAVYNESHKSGAGLYARAKFASSMAPEILEKASMSGLSIRASGRQAMESGRPMTKHGLPVLDEITNVESIDIVTKAGAGGVILTESARNSNERGEVEMTEAEAKTLKESLTATIAVNERLMKRALRGDAIELSRAILATTALNEAQRNYITENVVGSADSPRDLPVKEGGSLDAVKLTEAINAEAKRYAAANPGDARPRNMGGGAGPQLVETDPVKIAAREAHAKAQFESDVDVMHSLMGGDRKLAEAAVKGRAA